MLQLNVRVPFELHRRLKFLALRYEMSLSNLVEAMLTASLIDWEADAPESVPVDG